MTNSRIKSSNSRRPADGRVWTPQCKNVLAEIDKSFNKSLRPHESLRFFLRAILSKNKTRFIKLDWVEAEDLIWFVRVANKRYYKR